jgi:hypothetical protein
VIRTGGPPSAPTTPPLHRPESMPEAPGRSPRILSPDYVPEPCRHLGDGVYATYDGYGIELRVNDHRSPQVAYLEPQVVHALSRFLIDHQTYVAESAS